MKIRFLGKDSRPGDSPALYATDRDSYIFQGYKVSAEVLNELEIGEDQTCVEVTPRLFTYLAKDGLSGAVEHHKPPIVRTLNTGNLIIQGKTVFNGEALGHMTIPLHEDCVEVAKTSVKALLKGPRHAADHP